MTPPNIAAALAQLAVAALALIAVLVLAGVV